MIQWIKGHTLIVLLIIAAVFTFDWLIQCRKQLRIKWYAALLLTILHVAYGVMSVKLFALAEAGFNAEKAGNLSLFGAIFLMPLAYYLGAKLFRRSVSTVFDVFTIPLVLTLFCARINCTITGCCLGKIIPGTQMRWPTREAELLFYAVFLAFVISRSLKGSGKGRIYPLFMVAYGAFRAVIECFRENDAYPGLFHLSHLWAFITLALGIICLCLQKRNSGAAAAGNRSAAKQNRR